MIISKVIAEQYTGGFEMVSRPTVRSGEAQVRKWKGLAWEAPCQVSMAKGRAGDISTAIPRGCLQQFGTRRWLRGAGAVTGTGTVSGTGTVTVLGKGTVVGMRERGVVTAAHTGSRYKGSEGKVVLA